MHGFFQIVILVAAGFYGAFALGDQGSVASDRNAYDLPTMMTEIQGKAGSRHVMSTRFAVELEPGAPEPPKDWFDAVRHAMQERLSEYRVVELQGSAGMQRLRDDMIQAAQTVSPLVRVKDFLIHELTVE